MEELQMQEALQMNTKKEKKYIKQCIDKRRHYCSMKPTMISLEWHQISCFGITNELWQHYNVSQVQNLEQQTAIQILLTQNANANNTY